MIELNSVPENFRVGLNRQEPGPSALTPKGFVRIGLVIAVFLAVAGRPSHIYSQERQTKELPVFEVASLHEINLTETSGYATYWRPRPCNYQPDRIYCALSLRGFVREAWNTTPFQDYRLDRNLLPPNGPGSRAFELKATFPVGTSHLTVQLMLQELLEHRFGLRTHFEKRPRKAYVLVASKGGIKARLASSSQSKQIPLDFGTNSDEGFLKGDPVTLNMLADAISSNSDYGVPVLNATGSTGGYSLNMKWQAQDLVAKILSDPAFNEALKDLGLVLERRVVPVDVLVVDAVQQYPTDN